MPSRPWRRNSSFLFLTDHILKITAKRNYLKNEIKRGADSTRITNFNRHGMTVSLLQTFLNACSRFCFLLMVGCSHQWGRPRPIGPWGELSRRAGEHPTPPRLEGCSRHARG